MVVVVDSRIIVCAFATFKSFFIEKFRIMSSSKVPVVNIIFVLFLLHMVYHISYMHTHIHVVYLVTLVPLSNDILLGGRLLLYVLLLSFSI